MSDSSKFNVGEAVWYHGEEKATVVETLSDEDNHEYRIVTESGEEKDVDATHITNRRARIKKDFRRGFGKVRVGARSESPGLDSGINFSLSAQGSNTSLSVDEAREIAEALRRGGDPLELLIGDDPEEVADAFEEAADELEEFLNQS